MSQPKDPKASDWRKAARVLRISYRQAQMARVLGWNLLRIDSWEDRAGRNLAASVERAYSRMYGRADPYAKPLPLKERRRRTQAAREARNKQRAVARQRRPEIGPAEEPPGS